MVAAVFLKFLQTGCRNDSNDMSLDRYRRDVTFSCRTHSLIPYGLRAVSNLLNHGILFLKFFQIFGSVFVPVFQPFVETRRVIRRWKATNEVQLSYVAMFLRFLTVFSLF